MLSAPDKIRTELEMLENALRQCTDSGIREVIENWITAAKERLRAQEDPGGPTVRYRTDDKHPQ